MLFQGKIIFLLERNVDILFELCGLCCVLPVPTLFRAKGSRSTLETAAMTVGFSSSQLRNLKLYLSAAAATAIIHWLCDEQ